jgi:cytochrome c peroxidase
VRDTGRGNVTGLWRDLGRFKTPTVRALAARAPYFHNGIAATLEDVVRHYEKHVGFVFTDQERVDLVAFLKARCSVPRRQRAEIWQRLPVYPVRTQKL